MRKTSQQEQPKVPWPATSMSAALSLAAQLAIAEPQLTGGTEASDGGKLLMALASELAAKK